MLEVCISSKTDLITVTSDGFETGDVVGVVEPLNIGEDRWIEIRGREIPTELVGGRGGMNDIEIMDVVGEDVIVKVGGVTGGDCGVVVRFRKGSFRMLPKYQNLEQRKTMEKIPSEYSL